MITGIGIDVIQNDRIAISIQRFGDRFLNRIYTQGEIDYCKKCSPPEIHYAARFAAKSGIESRWVPGGLRSEMERRGNRTSSQPANPSFIFTEKP